MNTYEFFWPNRGKLVTALAKLQKKAAKLGVPFVAFLSDSPTRQEGERYEGELTGRVLQFGTCSYDVPQVVLSGWELVAVLSPLPTDDGSTVLFPSMVPGKSLPADVRQWSMECDHCKTLRRRSETFVVHHTETNEYKQVGRQCLADFIGGDVSQLLASANFINSLQELFSEENEWRGASSPNVYTLNRILETTSAIVRNNGWVSVKRAEQSFDARLTPTKMLVDLHLFGKSENAAKFRAENPITEQDKEVAEQTREFWANTESTSEYSLNAQVLAKAGTVPVRGFGLAVSMVPVFQDVKSQETEIVHAHVGTLKKRETFTVEKMGEPKYISTNFGGSFLYKLRTDKGNVLTWFASDTGDLSWIANATGPVKVMATVIRHEMYQGKPQTVINRVKPV